MQIAHIAAPLKAFERQISAAFADAEAWLRAQFAKMPPPFYASVDLRNNGAKIAPIDTNLFPGGFNNLPLQSHPLAAEAMRRQIDAVCPDAKSVLLLPENHTRNLQYLDNVAVIKRLLEMAGIATQLGRLDGEAATLVSASGCKLEMLPVAREGDRLRCGAFEPCAAILNNDLSAGAPDILQGLQTPVLPAPQLGWATRKKSGHFHLYQQVAEEFAQTLGADPWLLSAIFFVCPQVDFNKREGLECLATAVDETLQHIREKNREHGIADAPFVVVKANVGTYGMGVMRVAEAKEVFALNRKQRQRMSVGKEGVRISNVLIQEGIRTAETHNGASAEPVVYAVGGTVAGGFYRINAARGDSDNLNSSGMSFSPLPFATDCAPPPAGGSDEAARLYAYSVVARLAVLAAAREQAQPAE